MEHDKAQDITDNATCYGCVCALQSAIELDINDGEQEFNEGFGGMLDDMHAALAAFHRARRERFTNKHDEIANSWEAATKLVHIAAAVDRAIQRGRALAAPRGEE